jgi:serine/threonine-protein kinase
VAVAVRCELSDSVRDQILSAGTRDVEGYELYLRARFLWEQRTEAALAQALDLYRRALQRDPDFALAHAGLADALTILGIYGARPPADVMEPARKAADRALDLVPSLGEALAVRGCVRAVFDWDWKGAESDFSRAIEASPSYSTARQWYALNLLTPQGRFREATEVLERAAGLDPLSAPIATSRGILSFYSRSIERAAQELEAVRKGHPGFGLAYSFLGQCRSALGCHDDAATLLATALQLTGESSETLAAYGSVLAAAGRADDARAVLLRLQERASAQYVSPVLTARIHVSLGDLGEALSEMERAAELRASDLVWLGVRPVYDPLRGEARFQDLLARVGLQPATFHPMVDQPVE